MARKKRDLSKEKFGRWTPLFQIEGRRNGTTKWRCKCDCGNEKDIWRGHLIQGFSKSCGCIVSEKIGPKHHDWNGFGEISGNFWNCIQRHAIRTNGKKNKIEFSISIEYAWNLFIEQDKKCKLSGIELNFNFAGRQFKNRPTKAHTASLDRIDSSKGYIEGNVQWIHKDLNMMKRTYNQKYFIEMCKQVAKNNDS